MKESGGPCKPKKPAKECRWLRSPFLKQIIESMMRFLNHLQQMRNYPPIIFSHGVIVNDVLTGNCTHDNQDAMEMKDGRARLPRGCLQCLHNHYKNMLKREGRLDEISPEMIEMDMRLQNNPYDEIDARLDSETLINAAALSKKENLSFIGQNRDDMTFQELADDENDKNAGAMLPTTENAMKMANRRAKTKLKKVVAKFAADEKKRGKSQKNDDDKISSSI